MTETRESAAHEAPAHQGTSAALRLEAVTKRFGSAVAAENVNLAVTRGEFFTFLGSSGSGKSTLLRMIAGLETPDVGRVFLDGRDIGNVPPWRRRIGMVFQQYALFPHMDVAENIAYGLKMRKARAGEISDRVDELLDLVGLAGFQDRKVTQLSGGEQQRVALARALAPRPTLLLLDEPLGALDEKVRRQMQTELKRIQASTRTTFLYVTHDQEEALTMSDRIAIFHHGVMQQCADPDATFHRPANRFVASFFRGWNLLTATPPSDGGGTVAVAGVSIPLNPDAVRTGERDVTVGLRAEHIDLGGVASSHDVRLRADVIAVQYRGALVDHVLRLEDGQQLTATSTKRRANQDDRGVEVGFDTDRVVVFTE